jgi:serine/threonine protein kinase
LFSIQLLYKAWAVNILGFTNCDIKLENILFNSDSNFKEAYIVDYGLIQKDKPCRLGTEDYQPPETMYAEIDEESPKWTKYMTHVIQQADAFAMGVIILYNEISLKETREIQKIYEEINDNDSEYDTVIKDKTFHNLVSDFLNKRNEYNFNGIKFGDDEKLLGYLYHKVIIKLLNFSYIDRYPISVALFLLYKLYSIESVKDQSYQDLCKWIHDDEELLKLLGIDTNNKPEENIFSAKAEPKSWQDTSEVFESSIEDIKKLIKITPEAPSEKMIAV